MSPVCPEIQTLNSGKKKKNNLPDDVVKSLGAAAAAADVCECGRESSASCSSKPESLAGKN